jgi:hypothetical protein
MFFRRALYSCTVQIYFSTERFYLFTVRFYFFPERYIPAQYKYVFPQSGKFLRSPVKLGVQKTLCKWQISPLLSVGEGINKDPASGAKR